MLPINNLVKEHNKSQNGCTESSARNCSTDSDALAKRMSQNYEEFEKTGRDFQISVPWGQIMCREFGKVGGTPVLMTHGWLDNMGSWSQLIPELLRRNPNLHIVAFDEPGCGLSTSKPKGMYYEALGTVVDMRRIAKHMGWNKDLVLIGHSKGSFYSFMYASIFCSEVSQLISCDLIGPEIQMSHEMDVHIDQRIAMDLNFVEDPSGKRFNKVYTYEKALARFMDSRPIFGMKKCVAEILLKRGMRPAENGFVFTRDIQWNFFSIAVYPKRPAMLEFLSQMTCDVQLLTASEGPFKVDSSFWEDYKNVYKRVSKVFDDHLIKGKHYIHMDEADTLADKIVAFLKKSNEARSVDGNKL